VSRLLELWDDALLCEGCRGILRIEETEEDVDFRPRRPVELRRYDERGVTGEGESELRFLVREVSIRGPPGVVIEAI
jgi:hypothetical protein